MLKKEICIKFSEYKIWELEQEIKKINKKKLQKQIVIGMAVVLFITNNPTKVLAIDFNGLDELGYSVLDMVRRVAYWLTVLGAITEIMKSSMQGADREQIFKIITKYAIVYASIFIVPRLFTLIAEKLG